MAKFVHLRVHTDYSLVDGLARIKPLVAKAAALQMPALAVTDVNNFFGLIKFYRAALAAGIKPVAGADIRIRNLEGEGTSLMTLLVRNQTGYRKLTELISRGYTEGQNDGEVVIEHDWVAADSKGLIALSGGYSGEIGMLLRNDRLEQARRVVDHWRQIFPDSFYLEISRAGRPGEEDILHQTVALAQAADLPVVAVNAVQFLGPEDFEAHEARVCIHDSTTLADPRRARRFSDQQYLKSEAEMVELFEDIPEALENSVEIARRCNLELKLDQYFLPNFPVPKGETVETHFRALCQQGLATRLEEQKTTWQQPGPPPERGVYEQRLAFELQIILDMGFPGYFLIVMDFIRWARENGVPVGPGRGSGAGSLAAWSLRITDLDPLAYDLLFERFLNPDRVSMPDFDIDFCMEGRDRVIQYVADKYGRDAVSQIITFGTMAAKAVVRDVARVQGKPYSAGDRLSRLIPFEVGMTLAKALEQDDALREYVNGDEEAREIWDMALRLEGVTRNAGKHAGGVVIAPTRLTDFSPLYCDEKGGGLVTQFDKNDVEAAGLVKFDFLGLKTLTVVQWALETINRNQAANPLDLAAIPLDDPATFELLRRAETTAVFQLESRGMKDLIRRLLPDCFEDIIALVALFRPGPLGSGMVDDFINRKHGRAPLAFPHPDFQHKSLQPVLQPTYGIILYQEQVMQIAQVLAGYSLGEADLLRRAMGKKNAEVMARQQSRFVEGAEKNGIPGTLAEPIFELVEKFAGYGFNKSHSAAYAMVSYQTAWLKTHHPAAFMAAVLTADMENTDKVVVMVEECRRMQLDLVLPDVNVSDFAFTVNPAGQIVYGLGAVKGLGQGPVEAILVARSSGGRFTTLYDFCDRVESGKMNRRAIEALIRCGALDSLGAGRARLMAALPDAVKRAEQTRRNEAMGQADIFGDLTPSDPGQDAYASVADIPEWSDRERLRQEKETLGLYISGHPFDEYEREVRRICKVPLAELVPGKSKQRIAGLVIAVRQINTRRGRLIVATLDDRSGRVEISVFPERMENAGELLKIDRVLIAEGEIEQDEFSGGLRMRAESVTDIETARLAWVQEIELGLNPRDFASGLHQRLKALLPSGATGSPVTVAYQLDEAEVRIRLGDRFRCPPDEASLRALRGLLGQDRVSLRYH